MDDGFSLAEGRKLGSNYEVVRLLGRGTEGEVYQIRERDTGILRAAKLYYPHKHPKRDIATKHALKLNRLRHCPIVLQYHHMQLVTVRKLSVACLISELSEGQTLESWVKNHRGARLQPFVALCVLHALAVGLEEVHATGEYHSDIHAENILVQRLGVRFKLKLIDFYDWGRSSRAKQLEDVIQSVRLFRDIVTGTQSPAKLPEQVRWIISGGRRDRISARFPSMSALRQHLETFDWQEMP